jgi:capsular polysaccharide biosynthesis protein
VTRDGPVEFELDFQRLQQDVSDARERQEQLQTRLFRASITASSVMDDRNIEVSVLDAAYLPVRASSKPRSTFLAVLLVFDLILALATAFISAAVDDRVFERRDIERLQLLPVVAVIPRLSRHRSTVAPPSG